MVQQTEQPYRFEKDHWFYGFFLKALSFSTLLSVMLGVAGSTLL